MENDTCALRRSDPHQLRRLIGRSLRNDCWRVRCLRLARVWAQWISPEPNPAQKRRHCSRPEGKTGVGGSSRLSFPTFNQGGRVKKSGLQPTLSELGWDYTLSAIIENATLKSGDPDFQLRAETHGEWAGQRKVWARALAHAKKEVSRKWSRR